MPRHGVIIGLPDREDGLVLSNPLLLGLAAALVAGLVASFAAGVWRGGRNEVSAGIHALCGMKWRDYAHLVEDLLRERGFARSGEDRRPGDGGFDLLMTRGSSRYLIECKNGAAHRVTEQSVRDLAGLVELHGAEGAVLATTGHVDAAAYTLAANRRVELLAGADLWRQIKSWVPHDLRSEAESKARGGLAKGLGITFAVAIAAGVVAAALAPAPATAPLAAPAVVAPATSPSREAQAAAPAPVPAAPSQPMAMPDPNLSEDQLAARRAQAAMEARGNPAVQNVVWSTKSTMVVSLRQPGAEITDLLFDEVCRILVQFEEMRYTRLQIESPPVDPNAAPTVRFKQCR
jgi:restriction system protein